jgi:hypothetical protein
MFCPNCGKEIPNTAKVCGYCGNKVPLKVEAPPLIIEPKPKPSTPLPSPKPTPATVKTQEAKPGKSTGMLKWAWGLIGVLLVAGAVFLYAQFLAPTPQSVYLPNFCELDQFKNTAKAGTPIDLYYDGWGALGYKLTEENREHIKNKLLLDGQSVSGKQQKAVPSDEIPCGYNMPDKYDGIYWSFYKTTLDPLSVGEHDLLVIQIIDAQFTDGFDSDGDGQEDYYGPGSKTFEYSIIVEP